jgi:hypothetical protein
VGVGGYKERVYKGEYSAKYFMLMYENGKMRHVESVPGIGGGEGIKENDGGGKFNYDML